MTSYTRYLPLVVAPRAGLLALHPLFVTGMTRPIVGGDGGISIAVVNDHAQGALFVIDPWVSMLEGDTIDVFLDAQIVYHHVVTATEVDQRLFFYVEAVRFVPGWIEQCYYLLLRKGETAPDDPSVALRLRVKLDRPAGPDREPHKPGHSELKIVQLPEEVIRQGVDAEWAAKGVPMTLQPYPNIALRDTVQVKWGSVFLKPLVLTQAHVDGTQPIVITADQGEILAGGDSAALLIQYEVYDEVWNYSEKWSIPTTVNVDAGAWRLEQPIIKESVNGVIDLKGLNQQDVTVQIHVRTEDFELGDTITMTWIGTPQIGKPLIHTQSRDITNVPSILELKVPYEEVRAIAMGSADASYVLTKKNGGPPLSSKRTFADVIGDVYAHPAPTIREVVGEVLEPDVMYATVDISYLGMTDGDVIELMWDGSLSSGAPYLHTEQHTVSRNEAADKLITIYILDEHISVLANGRLTLWYRVSNDNAAYGVSESERLLVKVQAIAATLPAPQVPEAPDGVLDPSKVFDKVTVRIDYTGTVKDDFLTYYWTAISSAISTSDWLPITTVSAGKPVNFRVDASYVTPSIGQYVKIRYTLKHASTQLLSYSATLNLQIGQRVGDLPPPEVVQAANGSLDPMVATNGVDVIVKYDNMDPALDTIALKWRGTPGPGTSDDLELPAHASGQVQFRLPATLIGPNIGKSVAVSYDVKRYNFWNTSELLTLNVLRFQNPETQLPRPEVPQAIAGVLDLMAFSGNPDVVVQKWPFIALGQRLWLRLEGKTIAGADYRIVLLDGVLVTAGQVSNGLKEILSRTELLKLAHASAATVLCKVAFDGANDESSAIAFPLLPLTVRTRYDYVTPVITQVSDSRGEVAEGGLTFDKEVTLKGTATRGEKVELYDGSTSLGSADVGTNGTWERLLTNLTVKNYHITAHALYDADPVSSLLRAFTVEAAITPTIDSVKDSKGADVPLNGATFDTSVTVTGKASPDQAVQLYDGSTPIAPVTPVDSNGDWSKTFTGLSVAAHTIKAKARYGTEPESTARTFTVLQTVTPTITGVSDTKGEVPPNGTTFDTSVIVSGKASPDQTVQLYDGSTPITPVTPVDSNGNWSKTFTDLSTASHTIKAKALYGTEPESTARTFTVLQTVTPTITGVSDSKGEVPPNGTTFDTSVTVSGNASPNQAVQLYDGSTPFPSVTQVNGNGDWSQLLPGLSVAAHTIKAKARYGTLPESTVRAFTVAVASAPTIVFVKDSKGAEVLHNGTTFDTSVIVSGKANANQTLQLHNGNTPIGPVTSVSGNGDWSQALPNLSVASYMIKAKALYGTQPESAVRAFTVAVESAPTIAFVRDSMGADVQHNGTTFDTSVIVSGKASPNQTLRLYDGSTPTPSVTQVNGNGDWSQPISGLSVASHTIKAKALYGTQPESTGRTFTVYQTVTPTITGATDSKGEVPPNGTTFDTSVRVSGRASPNQALRLYDGSTPTPSVTQVNGNGDWSQPLTGLSVAAHTIKAKALYGTQPESTGRTFTVLQTATPTITGVSDSKGIVVIPNGTTFDTSVTVSGKANANLSLQLYDNGTPKGPVTSVNGNGDWSQTLTGLSVAAHTIKAKALYGTQPESAGRAFTVAAHTAPTLNSVRDASSEVQNGGQTTSSTVTLQGTVTPGHQVQIFDNGVGKHTVTAVGANWTTSLTVVLGSHAVKAKAVTTGQDSNTRSFTVISPTPPLNFNTSPVTLSGKIYLLRDYPAVLPAFGPGTSVHHQATGGQPGYLYTSSNPAVAAVDTTGLVTVRGRGTASITARDAANQSLSYTVTVTGVIHCLGLGKPTWANANSQASQQGARIPSYGELIEIHQAYGALWPMGNDLYWSTDPSNAWWPIPARKTFNLVTGANAAAPQINAALGVAIQ